MFQQGFPRHKWTPREVRGNLRRGRRIGLRLGDLFAGSAALLARSLKPDIVTPKSFDQGKRQGLGDKYRGEALPRLRNRLQMNVEHAFSSFEGTTIRQHDSPAPGGAFFCQTYTKLRSSAQGENDGQMG